MTGRRVRAVVVDDSTTARTLLVGLLSADPEVEVVGEASDGAQAITLAAQLLPDVVLMDLLMPNVDGVTAIGTIRQSQPETDIVAVTSFIEEEKVTAALEAGASGYLLKDAEPGEVAAAIRAAACGEVHLDSAVAGQLVRRISAPRVGLTALTAREREILALVAEGHPNRTIAERLVISERTARTHVSNVLSKLQLSSRTQAALFAIREGLIPPPG